jgi:hypothetical protein
MIEINSKRSQKNRCLSRHLKTETDPVSKTLCTLVFLEYRTKNKVRKPNNSEYYVPPSQPFSIYALT